jgi:hypothetical protein
LVSKYNNNRKDVWKHDAVFLINHHPLKNYGNIGQIKKIRTFGNHARRKKTIERKH